MLFVKKKRPEFLRGAIFTVMLMPKWKNSTDLA
jgi:hypothetical protein